MKASTPSPSLPVLFATGMNLIPPITVAQWLRNLSRFIHLMESIRIRKPVSFVMPPT